MISENDVKYVAALSRIHLKNEELKPLTKDLEKILDYITKLEKLDVSKIKPTSHVLPLKNVYHKDEIQSSLSQKDALQFSVDKLNGSFKVPKVIE